MIRKTMLTPLESLKTVLLYSHDDESELHFQDHKQLDTESLVGAGHLVHGEYANYYYCGCDGGNSAEIIWTDMPGGEPPRAIARCACGIFRVEPEELRTWKVPFLPLLTRIGGAMGFKPPFTEAVPGIVWSLGRKSRREFYYLRGVGSGQDKIVKSFFTPYPTAVIVAPTDRLKTFVAELLPDNLCFSVESLGAFDDSFNLKVDMEPVESEVAPLPETKKRVTPRRGNRAANIEKLTAEMKDHYRASRDHYYAAGDLLPRPTQGELAKRIGARQDDVSRCLADPDAVMLRLLWNQAEDIRAVLNS